jgi:hypothetical protein
MMAALEQEKSVANYKFRSVQSSIGKSRHSTGHTSGTVILSYINCRLFRHRLVLVRVYFRLVPVIAILLKVVALFNLVPSAVYLHVRVVF